MGVIGRALARMARVPAGGERATDVAPLSLEQWAAAFQYQGLSYPFALRNSSLGGNQEPIPQDFVGLARGAYRGNGVVFACMLARMLLFTEARFQFRRLRSGTPGKLFGTPALRPLEQPWPGGDTGALLTRAIVDVDLAGNHFGIRRGNELRRLRPDWMTIVLGSTTDDLGAWSVDAEVVGYAYTPGGPGSGAPPQHLRREEVAHWAPIPDPEAGYRGMSWLYPILQEIQSDLAATAHKLKFFERGATPSMVIETDPTTEREAFEEWVKAMRAGYEGVANAYKLLFLGGGAKATVVGANLRQMDFKLTQGAGETRIAAASGVPPIIVGLSEGLQAATYANYGQARRRFADLTMRPLWRSFCAAYGQILDVPPDAELWYSDREIPFLQEDAKDDAEIMQMKASAVRQLVDAGYTPESAMQAVQDGDLTILEHSGLYSVQLQPPQPNGPASASANGDGPQDGQPAPNPTGSRRPAALNA